MEPASWILVAVAALVTIGLVAFAVVSLREGEGRALRVSLILVALIAFPCIAAAYLPPPVPAVVVGVVATLLLLALALCFVGLVQEPAPGGNPSRQVDERDIMFARGRLREGTPEYVMYYAAHPENRLGDDRTRELPGLLSSEAELAEPLSFAAAKASFDVTEALRDQVDGEIAEQQVVRSPEHWSATLKDLALSYGAVDAGIAELQPYHVYSHIGRGTGAYGDPIDLRHRWALAFTVEMDHGRVSYAPAGPVVEESARQYVEGAKIAITLANWIRRLGYPARAHTDGNYRVIAPLVARDAGLGEIGRMGILMTPRLGPRVRLGVVTTDLPLVADAPGDDPTVIDFCNICRKCATNCPVAAIPSGDRKPIDGGLRWSIDSESCFRYWNLVGTDCASCMRVCPYSHPDNAAHNLVRFAIKRSAAARRAMLWFDDLFYGKKPPARQLPEDIVDRIEA